MIKLEKIGIFAIAIFTGIGFAWFLVWLMKHFFKSHIPHVKYNITITKKDGSKIPPTEPLYVFRAQDKYASDVLRYYSARLTQDKGQDYIVAKDALLWAKEFERWPIHKTPD